eukprot:5748200-Pleurochrysis_carterae.AAC.1
MPPSACFAGNLGRIARENLWRSLDTMNVWRRCSDQHAAAKSLLDNGAVTVGGMRLRAARAAGGRFCSVAARATARTSSSSLVSNHVVRSSNKCLNPIETKHMRCCQQVG